MSEDPPAKPSRNAFAAEQARLARFFQTIGKHRKALDLAIEENFGGRLDPAEWRSAFESVEPYDANRTMVVTGDHSAVLNAYVEILKASAGSRLIGLLPHRRPHADQVFEALVAEGGLTDDQAATHKLARSSARGQDPVGRATPRGRDEMSVERALRKLQAVAREYVDVGPPSDHRTYRVHVRQPTFVDHQVDAAHALKADLAADPRFEHMKEREIEEAVWAFAGAAHGSRDKSHVEAFLEQHAREPEHLECWFPVEGLSVPRAIELGGAKLVPAAEVELPNFVAQYPPPTMHAAIGAECVGTNRREMMRRARKTVEHALRVLRVGLAADLAIIDQQLRFRLGTVYWFSESAGGGGGSRPGEIIKLELPEDLLTAATSTPIATLTAEGGTKIEQAACRAVRWFEDSQLEIDPLKKTLFLFFALEAILGDDSEELKAEGLALRRAVLSHKQTEHFTHPGQIYVMYRQVRSAAVHGSALPEVPKDAVRAFSRDVRTAIGEFLEELYPEVVDAREEEGGVPSRLTKTDRRKAGKEGTPCQMFAGSPSGRTTKRSGSRSMTSLARVRVG